jgi:hypothetical protein
LVRSGNAEWFALGYIEMHPPPAAPAAGSGGALYSPGDGAMNVLLVSPKTPNTFWSLKHALRFVSKRSAFPPLGLLTVAAMLPKAWNLRLVDLNVRRLRDADVR